MYNKCVGKITGRTVVEGAGPGARSLSFNSPELPMHSQVIRRNAL
jgi:hypothetical protein